MNKSFQKKNRIVFIVTILFNLFCGANSLWAQKDSLNIDFEISEAKKKASFYQYSGYIPFDILDCIRVIGVTYQKQEIEHFKARNREEVYRFGIDSTETGIRKSWELEGQSHLAKYFNNFGLYYHKSMKLAVLYCYHDHLNQVDIHVKKNIRQAKSKYSKQERRAKRITKSLLKSTKKQRKLTYKKEDRERDNTYKQHNEFYQNRDKKLRQLEKKRVKDLKKSSR